MLQTLTQIIFSLIEMSFFDVNQSSINKNGRILGVIFDRLLDVGFGLANIILTYQDLVWKSTLECFSRITPPILTWKNSNISSLE